MTDPSNRGGAAILCVESHRESRARLEEALAAYDCVFASTAYDAVRGLHARPFDAHLLDYWMPDWSGPLLCREIKKYDPNAPVIMCSELVSESTRRRSLRAAAEAYLAKPIDCAQLLTKLQCLLRFSREQGARAADEAERAFRQELERRSPMLSAASPGFQGTARSVERTARSRSYRSFIDAGGTRAQFDRWWGEAYDPALAQPPETGAAVGS